MQFLTTAIMTEVVTAVYSKCGGVLVCPFVRVSVYVGGGVCYVQCLARSCCILGITSFIEYISSSTEKILARSC